METWLESVYSDGSAAFVSNPTPKLFETVTIRLRMYADAPVDLVVLRATPNGGELKQVVESVTILTMDGEEKTLSGEECAFGYRTSVYQKLPCVIVKAVLQLHPGDPEEIGQTMRTLMEKRRASQPLELPSAGSTFKRPTGYFAGPLIEQAGLKGCGVGGAEVSKKHAGFVVNTGGASADDVKKTIAMVQSRVWEASGVQLEPEVRIW